jgi:two-component system NarL family sensor kinase
MSLNLKQLLLPILLISLGITAHAQRKRIDSLLNEVKKDLHDTMKVRINYQLGQYYQRISNDSSDYFANRAIKLAQKTGDRLREAESYTIKGDNEKDKGKYELALAYYLKGLKIKEELGIEQNIAISYNKIGVLYKSMKRYKEAMAYYRKASDLCRKINLSKGIAMTYNNIGTIHMETYHADSALYYYKLGLAEAEKLGDPNAIATCLTNVGDVLIYGSNYKEALPVFTRCLAFDKKNEDKPGTVMSYTNIARTLSGLKRYSEADLYADTAYKLAQGDDLRAPRLEVLRVMIYLEKGMGHPEKALAFQDELIELKDSLLNEETEKQISELNTKYETEKNKHKIDIQQSEISRKNVIIAGISVIMLLGVLLGYSLYRRYKMKQQARLQLEIIHQQELATHAVIAAEERERKRIASDLHDGVGQLMSAAKMNLSVIGSELDFDSLEQKEAFDKVMDLVDEGCREVRTVSHNIMPNALLKSGLATATREFISKIDKRVLKVNLYTEGLNERIDESIESVLYRVIQESVNNVIKHSGADQLDISLIKDEEGISCTIEDNGQGFDTTDKSKFNGIGIKNIQSRVEYLKGSVEWDAAPGKGTVVTIHVPVSA